MPGFLCSSYLRVWRPIASLGDAERDAIRCASQDVFRAALRCRLPQSARLALLPPDERDEILVRDIDGSRHVCPSLPTVRALESLAMTPMSPDPTRLVSPSDIETAASERERVSALLHGMRPAVRQSTWHVPRRWFVCFEDGERRFEQSADRAGIRYETSMTVVRDRLSRALGVLNTGVRHPAMVAGVVAELGRWLATFPPDTIVELDYASVASLFDAEELADDHSAGDTWERIQALAGRDGARAAHFQKRLDARWAQRRALEHTN